MTVCNACRYCEGYCAVYPAMERRTVFDRGDILHLANLCFDCRDCLYACQYAPPHEFAINVPKIFAEVRVATYRDYGWPNLLHRLVETNRRAVAGLTGLSLVLVLLALLLIGDPGRLLAAHTGPGAFYVVAPYAGLVVTASALVLYGLAIFVRGAVRFWRDTGRPPARDLIDLHALWRATRDAFELRYLKGGGPGCQYPTARHSSARRVLHSLVFYGFLADLASTTLAAIEQDLLDILPPFPLLSPPVVLGTLGGVGLVIGTAGLFWLKLRADPEANEPPMVAMDVAFLALLGLTSLSGLLLLALRDTAAMGLLLAAHLGLVAGLFVTAPYGKFAHVVYRYGALVRNSIEQERLTHD
jgi:citrate/tricarballylate utilization protein